MVLQKRMKIWSLQRHFLYYALIVRSLKKQAKNNKEKQQKNIRPELIIWNVIDILIVCCLAHLSRRLLWAFLTKICRLSVICRRWRWRRFRFTFKSSSQEPLGWYLPYQPWYKASLGKGLHTFKTGFCYLSVSFLLIKYFKSMAF